MKEFPLVGKVNWDQDRTIIEQINGFIAQMGDNFDAQMIDTLRTSNSP